MQMRFLTEENSEKFDILTQYRTKTTHILALISLCLLGPLLPLNIYLQRWPLVFILVFIFALIFINVLLHSKHNSPQISYSFVTIPAAASVIYLLFRADYYAVVWVFPVIVFVFFAHTQRVAIAISMVMVLGVSAAILSIWGYIIAIRCFLAMGFVAVFLGTSIHIIANLQQLVMKTAITDPLTKTLNRYSLNELLLREISKVVDHVPASLVLLDVDHFKSINDLYGHGEGDAVLVRLVEYINTCMPQGSYLFRIGGEEFVLLLPNINATVAMTFAEQLGKNIAEKDFLSPNREKICDAMDKQQVFPQVTVSIGVSQATVGDTIDDWLVSADKALYQAKKNGRNMVCLRAG